MKWSDWRQRESKKKRALQSLHNSPKWQQQDELLQYGVRETTWGRPDCGGDSSAVRDQLKDVRQVQGTDGAFAAVLADGSVVTWGKPGYGGNTAILADGSVVTWGDPDSGGDSSAVQDQIKNVPQVQSTVCRLSHINK